MKLTDIEKIYTNKIIEFLADGYFFSTGTDASFARVKAYTDLRKGMELVRVSIEKDHRCPAEGKSYFDKLDVLRITVSRKILNDENQFSWSFNDNKMDSIDIVAEWYDVSNDGRKSWYITREEAAEANKLHMLRGIDKWDRNRKNPNRYHVVVNGEDYLSIKTVDDKAKRMVLPFLKRQQRCKSKKISDISYVGKEVLIKDDFYSVCYYLVTKNHDRHVLYANCGEVK